MSLFDQRDRLIRFLIEHTGRQVLTTGWEWDRDGEEFLRRQAALPAKSGVFLAAQKDGWQCERQNHSFLRAVRKVCRERGQTFIGYDNLHWGDDTVHGLGDIQDFPLGIGAKLRRWRELDADGVFDHWGGFNEHIWSNSIACREFFLNPDADVRVIADWQFGSAGPLVFRAWGELEKAHAILSEACAWTPWQWPAWYQFRSALGDPTRLRETQLPPRDHFNPASFTESARAVGDTWRRASPHYAAAAEWMQQALDVAEDAPVGYAHWHDASTITRRDHIRGQLWFIQAVGLTGREIGLQFDRFAGDIRLEEQAAACRAASHFFRELGKPKNWAEQYAQKAQTLHQEPK